MQRQIFGDITDPSVKVGSRKWYSIPLSIAVHAILLALLLIVPLLASDVLPAPTAVMAFVAPPAPPPPPPPPAPAAAVVQKPRVEVNPAVAPAEAPTAIAPEVARVAEPRVETMMPSGLPGNVLAPSELAPPPPPPPPPPPKPTVPIHVGGRVQPPQKIHNVDPVYPAIAQSARVQGIVIIEATIGPDGRVTDTKILKSESLLDEAAIAAVRQWQYTRPTLNGEPIAVLMSVTVTFSLK
jgi:protein TonB